MSDKKKPVWKEKCFIPQLKISKQSLLRGTREGNSVALLHAGISPDYNHLFCLYSAHMELKECEGRWELGRLWSVTITIRNYTALYYIK